MTQLQLVKEPGSGLIEVDGKIRRQKIGWNDGDAVAYLLGNPGKFVSVDELCRIFWGRVLVDNRARVRKRLSPFFKYALRNHGFVVVIEPDNNRGRAGAVKLLDKMSEYEQSLVKTKTKKMFARKELNEIDLQLVLQLSAPDQ